VDGPTDGCFATRGSVLSRDLQQTIGIDFKGRDQLSLTTQHRGDTSKLKLSKQTVVAALGAFTLVPVVLR